MKSMHSLVACIVFMAVLAGGRAAEEVDTIPAQTAARAWLEMVDSGSYGASWEQAAEAFRGVMPRDQWEKALVGARSPLGSVRSRKLRSVTYSRTLPGAPEGEYVVIQYDTVFADRGAVETITPMKEKDGTWRVSGYFIR